MAYDSDSSFSPSDEEMFDDDEGLDDTIQATMDVDERLDEDLDDQIQLYDGNIHPPQYYRQLIENPAPRSPYARYAQKFRPALVKLESRWNQYCALVLLNDPKEVFKSVTVAMLEQFLNWALNQRIGKNGRKMKGTKKGSSVSTVWKNLQIVYKVAMGKKFEAQIYNGMAEVVRDLTESRRLATATRVNRPMTTETLKKHIMETLSTTKKSFPLGELRIYAVLFLLLVSPQGSRAESILQLRFGDIKVVKARDPEGGPHNVLLRFTPEFTKRYLAPKEPTTSIVPENLFDRSLLLSPHVFLLGILFRHQAFQAHSRPEDLDKLNIFEDEVELPLPLKKDLDGVYIFRKAVKTLTGYELAQTERITYAMMASWLRAIGRILGIAYNVITYSLRYGQANNLEDSPNISEALRNLCLGHATSIPFQRHYISRQIRADTFAISLGERQQISLIKQACGIGHSMSRRRPFKLTPEQVASVNTDPLIVNLEQRRQKCRTTAEKLEATRALRNAKERKKKALLDQIREEWDDKQAVEDIQRQLRGEGFAPLPVDTSGPQHPLQKLLVAALTVPPQQTLDAQYERRNNAIHAVIDYCSVEERPTRCRAAAVGRPTGRAENGKLGHVDAAVVSVFATDENKRPRRCFVCVGKATSRGRNDPDVADLIHEYHSSSDLSKHFRRRHLRHLPGNGKILCTVCLLYLDDKMHFQNHAHRIHGTVSG